MRSILAEILLLLYKKN